ncbi:MAG: ABC transporter permease, partial [Gaiellaceae bacterium]
IMAGAYTLVLLSDLPLALRAVIAALVTISLAVAMERIAFRPLRDASPATLLVASFAVSIGLQSLALIVFGAFPRSTHVSSALSQSFVVAGISISRLSALTVGLTVVLLVGLGLFLRHTALGVQMRASAENFWMARALGVRANRVIAAAFAASGLLAAAAAFLLTAQRGEVTPTFGLNAVLIAFVATILGGLGSLVGAVLGGFFVGALTVALQASLPLELRSYRDAFVFAAVLAVIVFRPQGLVVARSVAASVDAAPPSAPVATRAGGTTGPRGIARRLPTLALLCTLVATVSLLGSLGSDSLDRTVINMLVNLTLVVGLYLFVGNSGVFSFGHIAFMAVGAYTAAILTIPVEQKGFLFTAMPDFLRDIHLGTVPAILAGGAVAATFALIVSVPLMRLSGLAAGLGTFAVLVIVNDVAKNWEEVTNGLSGLPGVPQTTTVGSALVWALLALAVAFLFQQTRACLRLRASREDAIAARAIGVKIGRERRISFCLSAFVMGVG